MAKERHLNYKTLYLPEESYDYLKTLRGVEEEKNYHLILGYTDLGAFLTPLSIMSMQENIHKFRKSIFDIIFTPCSVRQGLTSTVHPHINIELKTFVDFSDISNLEVIIS